MRLVLLVAVVLTFTMPRQSSALADWIWELSGPWMLGTGVYCAIQFDGGQICDEYGGLFIWQEDQVGSNDQWFWVRASSSFLWSVDNNPTDSTIYASLFRAQLEAKWPLERESLLLYSGAGYSYNYFFGSAFENYDSPAWTLTPVAFQWDTGLRGWILKASFDVRWFNKTFNPADVSNPLSGSERTYGGTFGFVTSFDW